MWLWAFMTIVVLFTPLLMILLGNHIYKKPPEEISGVYGYRTPRSMKNKETWEFSQKRFGRIFAKLGWILIMPSILVMILVINSSEETIAIVGVAAIIIQCIFITYSIVDVERALKKNFDEFGRRL